MSDIEPTVRPYEPFPSFAEWQAAGAEFSTFERFQALFDEAKLAATPDSLKSVVATATRWAAIDTGAIEGLYDVDRGFTMSVAVGASVLDAIKHAKGESVARAVSDALNAYEFVLDAATQSVPITEMWIRELHQMICRSQETYQVFTQVGPQERPFPHGEYKTESNSPLNYAKNEIHSYAPPMDTRPEMARLVSELRSDEFAAAHPVLQASYAHYAFVGVHPFADGNGRVSRALASVFLYRSPGVPLVIFVDEKPQYLDALEAADSGDYGSFINFVSERAVDTMNMVRQDVNAGVAGDSQAKVAALQALMTGRAGIAHEELDALAIRLSDTVAEALVSGVAAEAFEAPLSASVGAETAYPAELSGYRVVSSSYARSLTVTSAAPAAGSARHHYLVYIARPATDGPDFLIRSDDQRTVLEVLVREVHPTISAALQYRLSSAAKREIASLLDEVTDQAHNALVRLGYLES